MFNHSKFVIERPAHLIKNDPLAIRDESGEMLGHVRYVDGMIGVKGFAFEDMAGVALGEVRFKTLSSLVSEVYGPQEQLRARVRLVKIPSFQKKRRVQITPAETRMEDPQGNVLATAIFMDKELEEPNYALMAPGGGIAVSVHKATAEGCFQVEIVGPALDPFLALSYMASIGMLALANIKGQDLFGPRGPFQ